ncbi:MAG: hypothetical protein Q4P17_04790 [Methanobacterium sp.]|nr:hypothetical protein [Methanobacterium sp.]
MTDIEEPKGWWARQSSGTKGLLGVAGVCCIGIILIVLIGGILSPDSNTSGNSTTNISKTSYSTPAVAAESESDYKASCKSISFKELEKNPDGHSGERVKYTGEVVQIMENYGVSSIRMDVGSNFGDTIYVSYPGTTSAVEGSTITVYGVVDGSYTYTSQAGWEISLPKVTAKYIVVGT